MNAQSISSIPSVPLKFVKIDRILTNGVYRNKLLSTDLMSMLLKAWHTTPGEI